MHEEHDLPLSLAVFYHYSSSQSSDCLLIITCRSKYYQAPEQLCYKGVCASPPHIAQSPATDVYGLGCLMYFLIERRSPYQGLDDDEYFERLRVRAVALFLLQQLQFMLD